MNQPQVFEQAANMFLHGKRRKEVIQFLNNNGIHDQEADDMATKAYLQVKDQRHQMIEEMPDDQGGFAQYDLTPDDGEGGNGIIGIIIGIVLILGTVAVFYATGRLFYVAAIIGVITTFSGIAKMFK